MAEDGEEGREGSYVDLVLVVPLGDGPPEQLGPGQEVDLLGADQTDKEQNPEEQVDEVQEEPQVESLLVSVLHIQGSGHQLGYPGEAEETEDLDEPEELSSASLLAAVAAGPVDTVRGIDQ